MVIGCEKVAIKFQQFGDESIASRDGFALDNISVTGTSIVDGTSNDDNLIGGDGKDKISGFNGQDILNGLAGDDELDGGNGDDKLFGGDGNDSLLGGSEQDQLFGDAGDDLLDGGSGDNTLTGGFGADTFVLSTEGKNTITDFQIGEDVIGLGSGLTFDSLSFMSQNGGTSIATVDNQPLAFFNNVDSQLLSADDFVLV